MLLLQSNRAGELDKYEVALFVQLIKNVTPPRWSSGPGMPGLQVSICKAKGLNGRYSGVCHVSRVSVTCCDNCEHFPHPIIPSASAQLQNRHPNKVDHFIPFVLYSISEYVTLVVCDARSLDRCQAVNTTGIAGTQHKMLRDVWCVTCLSGDEIINLMKSGHSLVPRAILFKYSDFS